MPFVILEWIRFTASNCCQPFKPFSFYSPLLLHAVRLYVFLIKYCPCQLSLIMLLLAFEATTVGAVVLVAKICCCTCLVLNFEFGNNWPKELTAICFRILLQILGQVKGVSVLSPRPLKYRTISFLLITLLQQLRPN